MVTDSRGKSAQGTVTLTVDPAPTLHVAGDFDGNGSTDRSLFRPTTGPWDVGSDPPTCMGLSGDAAVPGDCGGDGTDVAVLTPATGAWSVGTQPPVYLGLDGDVPLPLPGAIYGASSR